MNDPKFWYKTLCCLIWKPIPVVFIELRHIIDSHSEIYAKNNSYKPKINILTLIEILIGTVRRKIS